MTGWLGLVKLLHILTSTVLLGTGAGIAFFMFMAHRTRDARIVASVARTVVVADFLFTATAVVAQPISGALLIWLEGRSFFSPWLIAAYALFLLTGACWLPVVAIQMKLKSLAEAAASADAPLPPSYDRLFRVWFALGVPAFTAVIGIFALMVMQPGA